MLTELEKRKAEEALAKAAALLAKATDLEDEDEDEDEGVPDEPLDAATREKAMLGRGAALGDDEDEGEAQDEDEDEDERAQRVAMGGQMMAKAIEHITPVLQELDRRYAELEKKLDSLVTIAKAQQQGLGTMAKAVGLATGTPRKPKGLVSIPTGKSVGNGQSTAELLAKAEQVIVDPAKFAEAQSYLMSGSLTAFEQILSDDERKAIFGK